MKVDDGGKKEEMNRQIKMEASETNDEGDTEMTEDDRAKKEELNRQIKVEASESTDDS